MNRTDRLYAIVEDLRGAAPRPRSARQLAGRFEVSSRTIERDLAALQQAGVPIWAEPGRTGGYVIDPAHTLAPLGFTVDEAFAVTIALGMLASSPFGGPAATALRKVAAVMDGGRLNQTIELATRVHLLEGAAPTTVPHGFAEALRSGTVLHMRYRDRNGDHTVRDIEPLGYIGRDGHWYLIAWCRIREGVRAFRSDRIVTIVPTGERPPPRDYQAKDLNIPYGDLRPAYAAD
ncbi:MAG TPA: YafY family protein [Arthrobacter sp.]|nr:YafY family protein [Arthrobacter sp.]